MHGTSNLDSNAKDLRHQQKETEKAWNCLNLIVTKVAELEMQNADLLTKKIENQKISETEIQKFQERENQLTESLETATLSLNATEKKVQKLQLHLTETESQLEALTVQLTNVKQENQELRTRHKDLEQTTERLREFSTEHRDCDVTRMAKSAGDQTIELQTIIEKVESQLQSMTILTNTFSELSPRSQRQTTEESERHLRRAMADDFDAMRRELERLMSQYEHLQKNSQRQKHGSKNRYNQLKEDSRLEREQLQDRILRLENELKVTRSALEKEKEYKDTMAKRQRDVLTEQRNLIARVADHEDMDREQKRRLVLMEMRSAEEERERDSLVRIVDDLTLKQHELKKIIGELQAEKQKMEWYKLASASAPNNNITILSSSGDRESFFDST